MSTILPFYPELTNAIAATATSQSRLLPSTSSETSAVFYNDGPVAFVTMGLAAVVATLPALSTNVGAAGNSTPIPVGASINLSFLPAEDNNSLVDYWAVICPAAGTANVYCTAGRGI